MRYFQAGMLAVTFAALAGYWAILPSSAPATGVAWTATAAPSAQFEITFYTPNWTPQKWWSVQEPVIDGSVIWFVGTDKHEHRLCGTWEVLDRSDATDPLNHE